MKMRPMLLALLMLPSLCYSKHDRVGDTIQIYGVKDYSGAFLEGFLGSCMLFYGSFFYAITRDHGKLGISGAASLVSGLAALGGVATIGDALRRAFASAVVMVTISPEGLLFADAGLVPWHDIMCIECVSFTTVQYGRPFTNGYQLNLNTKESVPVEIDGALISESMNTLLTFIRKFYKGDIKVRKEVVQDMTPRPTTVHANSGNSDLLVNMAQLGITLWGNRG